MIDGSEEMCRRITELGGQARYTAFNRLGHDCWDLAVEETDLVQWMLSQRATRREMSSVDSP